MKKLIVAACCALMLCGAQTARASTILYQSIPNLTDIAFSGWYSPFIDGTGQAFASFSLLDAVTIDQVQFVVNPVAIPTINVGIFDNTAGIPGTQIFSEVVVPSNVVDSGNGQGTQIVSLNLNGLSLDPGTYYISFLGASYLPIVDFIDSTSQLYLLNEPFFGTATFNDRGLGFALSGDLAAVPLPAALPLFASGLAGLGWLSRRRRKQPKLLDLKPIAWRMRSHE